MRNNRRVWKIAALAAAVLMAAVLLTACGSGGELKKAAKNINNYTIEATYDGATHTLTAAYTLSYINRADTPLSTLNLHLYPNAYRQGSLYRPVKDDPETIAKAYPDGISYGDITVSNVKIGGKEAAHAVGGADSNILVVNLPAALYPDQRTTLTLDFVVRLANIMHRTGYNARSANLANFYPIACVYEDGAFVTDPYYNNGDCFYSDLGNYDVTLTAAADMKVASTGRTLKTESVAGGTRHTIQAKAVRDFAMVLGSDYQMLSGSVDGTTVYYYYYDDEDPGRALQTGLDSIRTFNELFGKYPYETFSVVKTGFLHGGMEYPNLVMISDALDDDYFQEVIAHETAHQWWYGLVGSNAVRDPWLDEGLTDYCTTLFYEYNPQYGVTKSDRIMETMKRYILYVDIYSAINKTVDTSMNRPTYGYKDEYEYVYMTYVKGELLFDSLRHTIGDKAFFSGLQLYLKDNKYQNVRPSHMIGAFESASGRDLEGFFNAWTEGKVVITDLY